MQAAMAFVCFSLRSSCLLLVFSLQNYYFPRREGYNPPPCPQYDQISPEVHYITLHNIVIHCRNACRGKAFLRSVFDLLCTLLCIDGIDVLSVLGYDNR